jgi:hypothetical protein
MALPGLWRAVVSDFVNFVAFADMVRTTLSPALYLLEREISHQIHRAHEVHKVSCFAFFFGS